MDFRLDSARVVVRLPRDGGEVCLDARPLPLGFSRRLKERGIVIPQPDRSVARDSAGKVQRDERGEPVLIVDESKADYQASVERYHERVAVLMVAESVGDQLMFDAVEPASDTGWDEYADAIAEELEQAGFTSGDLLRVCAAVCEASRLTSRDLASAGNDFFCSTGTARSSPD